MSEDVVGWVTGPTERGTLMLIWSCVITIFACTWTVLHLNVPGPNDTPLTIALRKAKWMIINILFPEFVFSKAVCDLRLALQELRDFDEELQRTGKIIEWTTHHGRFDIKWAWEIEYPGRWPGLLYGLLRLDRPPKLARAHCPLRRFFGMSSARPCPAPTDPESAGFELQSRHGFATTSEGHRRLVTEQPHSELTHQISSPEESQQNSRENQSQNAFEELQRDNQAGTDGGLPDPAGVPGTGPDADTGSSNAPSPGQDLASQATEIRQRKLKWTIFHSYYAQMGGLVFPDMSEGRVNTMTASHLTQRFKWHEDTEFTAHPIMHLILEKDDILDKSKADWLLKSLAVLQVAWIITNVIARHIAQLPISQLEIATLAFAVMAILIYLANWWKPKDISEPTMLQFCGSGVGEDRDRKQSFTRRIWSPVSTVQRAKGGMPYQVGRIANDSVWLEGDVPLLFKLVAGSSLVFGGLHCLAWNFEFPTYAELVCWRVASLASAVLPLLTLSLATLPPWGEHLAPKLSHKLGLISPVGLRGHIMNPAFLHWDEEAQIALFEMPSELRDWEVRPTADAIERWRTEDMPHEFIPQLVELKTLLTIVIPGIENFGDQENLGVLVSAARRCKRILEDNRTMLRFWLDYEEFLRTRHPELRPAVDGSNTTTYFQQILNVLDEVSSQAVMFRLLVSITPESRMFHEVIRWTGLTRAFMWFAERAMRTSERAVGPAERVPGLTDRVLRLTEKVLRLPERDLRLTERVIRLFERSTRWKGSTGRLIRFIDKVTVLVQRVMHVESIIAYFFVYAAARLFILVIIFTCFRASPANLYQDNTWSRFLPKIS